MRHAEPSFIKDTDRHRACISVDKVTEKFLAEVETKLKFLNIIPLFFFFFKPDPFPLYSTACSLKLLFLPLNVDLSSAFSALQHHYHITIITTLIILASAQQINKCFFLALHYCKSNGGENCCSPEHA